MKKSKKPVDFEIAFFEGLVERKPDYIDALIPLAEAYTRQGLYDKGLKIDRRLSILREKDPVVHYNLACSYALVGKKQEAIQALKSAIQLGYVDLKYMGQDPDLETLREDAEFLDILKKTP